MRIFLAGSTGAIGKFLVPALVEAGHDVAGLTRREEMSEWLTSVGATPVVCDLYDPRLAQEIANFAPQLVMHQVTDLPSRQSLIALKVMSLNRARTEGTDLLIAAAKAAGAQHFVAQSIGFKVPAPARKAVDHLEAATLAYPGVVLRYGAFYGPGTWTQTAPKGGGVHVRTAAARTVELLTAAPGIYEVTDAE
jgi:nucleoside-diphosphate-sugar epimerase